MTKEARSSAMAVLEGMPPGTRLSSWVSTARISDSMAFSERLVWAREVDARRRVEARMVRYMFLERWVGSVE